MGEHFSLETIYDEHAQALFAYVLNLTRDELETHDVLQDVFLKLAAQPQLLNQAQNQRNFLLGLAHNRVIDRWRRRDTRLRRECEFHDHQFEMFAVPTDPDKAQFQSSISKALLELPAEQRSVVHLKLWEGMTFDAIAEVLGIPPNTAASRFRYGIDKLRDRLRPIYEEIQ